MHTNGAPLRGQADLLEWEKVTTAYWTTRGLSAKTVAGSNARTEAARIDALARVRGSERPAFPVDVYIDPICPYTWLVTRWLRLVEQHREVDAQYHPMSLRILYQQASDNQRVATAPSRVATAIWLKHGQTALKAWHTAFGELIFDHWRHPTAAEYRAATARALHDSGLPEGLMRAADTEEYDEPLRQSHLRGTLPVGVDAATPIIHLDGMAYLGPVLSAIPTTDEALDLFDGVVLLARCPDFFELKRTRTSPPVLANVSTDPGASPF